MTDHRRIPTRPVADPANVVTTEHGRITVLADGLVRLEWDPSGTFEDRASQLVLHRDMAPVEHRVVDGPDRLEVITDRFHLTWDRQAFWSGGVSVRARGGVSNYHSTWRPGADLTNLGGTVRTLDEVDGRTPLDAGLLSRDGLAVVDDSHTLLLDDDGHLRSRRPDTTDLYVFVFGRDYGAALDAFHAVSGPQPLVPRWVLGNWWSRYHPYSEQSYLALLDRFAADGLPFSVGILDMDWHLVDDVPAHLGSGWTGYTWNRALFPDPPAFLAELHERGLHVGLNVHPADGVRAHEDVYEAMANRVGIDPSSELPVAFDPTDPEFLAAYFEEVHHGLEADGVDFWWLDWQQGEASSMPGLDPLWVLNHHHWLDSGRDGGRELTFSRWAGLGSHRYPVGFSGDTVVSWESLDFQPEFTATAANVGYGWWSHDIGGHFGGVRDDELATRWVQLGVFSPIMRLHAGADEFNRRAPWDHGIAARVVMEDFLRLRHRLVPYLATMNHRTHRTGRSLVTPMYHDHPWEDEAYQVPNQYRFGSELLVAPITRPGHPVAGLGRAAAWLPPGRWVDLFTGVVYDGDRRLLLHRPLEQVPVLAGFGTILPVVPSDHVANDVAIPEALELVVVPGADASFTLVEDRDDDLAVETELTWDQAAATLRIAAPIGAVELLPEERDVSVVLAGGCTVEDARATVGDDTSAVEVTAPRDPVTGAVRLRLGRVPRGATVEVVLTGRLVPTTHDPQRRCFDLLDRAMMDRPRKNRALTRIRSSATPADAVLQLRAVDLPEVVFDALAEVLLASATD
ncbi:glycoside hydrolase family 31 protein [Salsipaludibacter albus]|uniref:glycoside hydrolase family 31 protein n=1 Tax=Salsipaludibacter albus TaxID=2849650 RepID=UPI001EE3B218|nr:glycoside hydrolase family 31 protein [Salsipaludibacter albus]MBY5162272.1 glycoside hydrolase family 31 protein [Salsipaludibacter albus]